MVLTATTAISSSDCPSRNQESNCLLPVNTAYSLSFKSKVFKHLHLCLYLSGLSSLYGWARTKIKQESTALILMYHSIPDTSVAPWIDPCNSLSPEIFEKHIAYLANHRHVISIDRLVQQLEQGEPLQPGTVAITFDDGYLDNLTVAAPILAKYNLPATIYLATSYIDSGENQWIDCLYTAFRSRSQHQITLPTLGTWQLDDPLVITQAYHTIALHLIQLTYPQRKNLLTDIKRQLAPTAHPPRLTMTWADVRQIQQDYPNITLGVHTASHLDLRTHPECTDSELTQSIHQFKTATSEQPHHMAFPYNRYSPQAQKQVANYLRSAVAIAPDPVVRRNTSLYALPRLEAPKSLTMLKSWTNSGFPDLSHKLIGCSWVCSS